VRVLIFFLAKFPLLLLSFLHLPLLNFGALLYITFCFFSSGSFFRVSSSFFGVGTGSVSVSLVAALFLHLVFALSSACFLFVRILGCFRLSAIFSSSRSHWLGLRFWVTAHSFASRRKGGYGGTGGTGGG
jgi:hypothetical protein